MKIYTYLDCLSIPCVVVLLSAALAAAMLWLAAVFGS